jgi:hypothetical protein
MDALTEKRQHLERELAAAKQAELALVDKLCDALDLNDAAAITALSGDLECNLAASKQFEQCLAELPDQHCPEPIPLLLDTAPPTPYPIDSLPKLMQVAARAIAGHAQAPLALAGQCVVSHAAHLAQTRVNAPDIHNPDGMPCTLYMLTLGNSGDRKSSCRKLAFKVIDEAEREARTHHHQLCKDVAAEADMLKAKDREKFLAANPIPRDPRTQFTDATYEPIVGNFIRGNSAASWDTDEGGQVLGGYSLNERSETRAATIGGLSKIYDDGTCERTRAHGNQEGSGFAYHRRLNMHLMAQPVTVAKALADPLLIAQGFLPRFLFASPESIAGTRFLTPERLKTKSYNDPHLQAYWSRSKELIASQEYIDPESGEVKPPMLALTDEAELVWLVFYNEVERGQGPLGQFAGLRPFAGRAGEHARRVAAVFAFFEGSDLIDGNCMRCACEIVRYSLEEWLRYTDRRSVDPELTQANELMKWLRDPERASKWREFSLDTLGKSGPEWVRTAKKRDSLIAKLLEHHILLPGAAHRTFIINPLLPADSADSAEKCGIDGFAVAENLRKSAENLQKDAAPKKNPQPSAKNPQGETLATCGFPQNPQNPQTPHVAEAINGDGLRFTGEI